MADPLIGVKLGNYRLERLLGRGRMGVVYLACDEALLRPTALKLLSWTMPEQAGHNPEAWFLAEARNVARVNHPHVVQIYGVARHGNYCYIAMEYVDGASADVWIAKDGPFSPERATEVLIHAADALQAAHEANVIHRDIKPENLLLGKDGRAKLGDFGMAYHVGNSRNPNSGRAGTPHYSAPEIWRGEGASVSTDLYALGATYYYLLSGKPPFSANDLQALIAAHLNAPIPQLRIANSRLVLGCQTILNRCLAKAKSQRFESALTLGLEARQLLRETLSFPPPPPSSVGAASVAPKPLMPQRAPSVIPGQLEGFSSRAPSSNLRSPYDSTTPLYTGEPFSTALNCLIEWLDQDSSAGIFVTGPRGVGKTTLVAGAIARYAEFFAVGQISCKNVGPPRFLAGKALRALGVIPGLEFGKSGLTEALVARCIELRTINRHPLLIVDDANSDACDAAELASLATAARFSSSFRLLVIGDQKTATQLVRSTTPNQPVEIATLQLRPLSVAEAGAYVQNCVTKSFDTNAQEFLFTPDALLLLAHRSSGLFSPLTQMAQRMLVAANARGRRVLDSWDAWIASTDAQGTDAESRPSEWPTPEVLAVLNECRRHAGHRPRR